MRRWDNTRAITPERCQDKYHTITQHNTTPLWPLNNLALNFHKRKNEPQTNAPNQEDSIIQPQFPISLQLNRFSPVFMLYNVVVSEIDCNGFGHKQTRRDYKRLSLFSHSPHGVFFGLVIYDFILVYFADCHNTAALMLVVFPTLVPLSVPYPWFMHQVSILCGPSPLHFSLRYFSLFLKPQLWKTSTSRTDLTMDIQNKWKGLEPLMIL